MPSHKSLKNLLFEIVLCFTVVALASHLSTIFWERYVMHKELCGMKNNLEILKVTVNSIGNAYDNLHNELLELAENTKPKHLSPQDDIKFSYKDQDKTQTSKILDDKHINRINDRQIYSAFKGVSSTDNAFHKTRKLSKNATTLTRYPTKTTAIGCDSYPIDEYLKYCKYCKFRYSCKLKDTHKCRLNL